MWYLQMNYDYLLADLKKPPTHLIWIEHLTKKVMFCHFRFANAPPPFPYRGNGGSLLARGCSLQNISGSAFDCFHNMLHGRSIVYI